MSGSSGAGDLKKLFQLKKDDLDAYLARGIVYGKKGEFDRSIADFNEALKIDPLYSKALLNRAISYYNKKDYVQADNDVQRLAGTGYPVDEKFILALKSKLPAKSE